MTTAKLKPAPADGHGLTPRVVDAIYDKLAAGENVEPLVGHFMLEPVEHGEKKTAAGTTRWVRFEATRMEPLTDQHDIDSARWQIKQSWDARHVGSAQQPLPMDFDGRSVDEQRRFLLGLIEDDWGKEQELTQTDIAERWRTQWGIEGDAIPLDGAFPHPDYRKAAPHHLREFCHMVGVLSGDLASDEGAEADTVDDSVADEG